MEPKTNRMRHKKKEHNVTENIGHDKKGKNAEVMQSLIHINSRQSTLWEQLEDAMWQVNGVWG